MTTLIELTIAGLNSHQDFILQTVPDAKINEILEVIKTQPSIHMPEGQVLLLFAENSGEALPSEGRLDEHGIHHGHRVHAHHCRHIEVSVENGALTKTKPFSPASTINAVKDWALVAFGLPSTEAFALEVEHENGHLSESKILGSLTQHCGIRLELVPDVIKIDYTVDDEPQVSDRRHRTPKEILATAGFDAAQYYLKHIRPGHQGESYQNRPDFLVRLHEHEKFSAIYVGGTTVS